MHLKSSLNLLSFRSKASALLWESSIYVALRDQWKRDLGLLTQCQKNNVCTTPETLIDFIHSLIRLRLSS
jgi:hypothetical protein